MIRGGGLRVSATPQYFILCGVSACLQRRDCFLHAVSLNVGRSLKRWSSTARCSWSTALWIANLTVQYDICICVTLLIFIHRCATCSNQNVIKTWIFWFLFWYTSMPALIFASWAWSQVKNEVITTINRPFACCFSHNKIKYRNSVAQFQPSPRRRAFT